VKIWVQAVEPYALTTSSFNSFSTNGFKCMQENYNKPRMFWKTKMKTCKPGHVNGVFMSIDCMWT
jgi:hypothetical protein